METEKYNNAAKIVDQLFVTDGIREDFPPKEKIDILRKKFLNNYSPEMLEKLSGFDIWTKLWNTSPPGLINALRNNGEYAIFGSAKSKDNKGLPMSYNDRKGWISFYEPKRPLSEEKARYYGERFRNKLLACVKRIGSLQLKSVEDFEILGQYLEKELDGRGEHLWLHKYLHMLYPEYFSQFHTAEWKRNVLCILGVVPKDSYYGMEGQLAIINSQTQNKNFYEFAVAIYKHFDSIGEDKVCLITPKVERIKEIQRWAPDSYIDFSTDWFEDLYENEYFQKNTPGGNYRKKNHIFVVEKDSIVYGIIHDLAEKKTSKKTFSRVGIWKPCFSSDERFPVPNKKAKGVNREVVDYSQLIFIYQHYFGIVAGKNQIELMLEKHIEEYNRDFLPIKKNRDILMERYPVSVERLSSVFSTDGISDFSRRIVKELQRADAIYVPENVVINDNNDTYYNTVMIITEDRKEEEGSIDPHISLRIRSLYHPETYLGIDDVTILDLILDELSLPIITEQSLAHKHHEILKWISKKINYSKEDPYQANYCFIRAAFDALGEPFYQPESIKKHHEIKPVSKSYQKEYKLLDTEDQLWVNAEKDAPDHFEYTGIACIPEYYEDTKSGVKNVIKRNPKKRINALVHADYRCEINPAHPSFISKRTGKPYMETHHLVPLEQSRNFEYSLDVEENLICLCSNCHNEIHYGENRQELARKLFQQRKNLLDSVKIDISEEELLDCYCD